MGSTTLSSKGQVIIPKALRDAQQWPPGTVFRVIARDGGVLLTPEPLFAPTRTEQAAGCLRRRPAVPRVPGKGDEAQAPRRRALAEDDATRS